MIRVIAGVFISFFCCVASAQPNCTTNSGYLAAVSEELFDKAIGFAVQKDNAALQKLLDTGLVISLKAGVPVYLEDTKIFSGKAQIRPQGSTATVWTNIEAVKCR